jgi:6-pyruvoyltetrahydropterin/6-carboxytetrahydropterin synthase
MQNPQLTRSYRFCAAHRYGNPNWSAEKNEEIFGLDTRVHGHNYTLEITVTGPLDPETGFVILLSRLDAIVSEKVLDLLDHYQIEKDIPWFQDKQPSSENLVVFIWGQIEELIRPAQLVRVRLRETPTIFTDYFGKRSEL